jgi:hypothetical protein
MIDRRHMLFMPLLLSACAAQTGDFPSLAPRPVEQRGEAEPAASTPLTPPAAAAGLSADLAGLLGDARKGDTDFSAALPATERAVSAARGAAPSSEAWIAAQTQLTVLDAARAPTATAMSAIDSLYVGLADKASRDASVGGLADAAAAQAEIEGLYNRQVERLTRLQGSLSQP